MELSNEENLGFLNRTSRATRGKRMNKLLDEEVEWNHSADSMHSPPQPKRRHPQEPTSSRNGIASPPSRFSAIDHSLLDFTIV
ncbi:hypothetical protein BVRB_013970 [Beta vulgaris subsp. vulgaris]|uniref:Uncharacterized protein n=1 Tax=Beta vulgaris subsp. vulgaris TaxID=3555 RepID=A0A0J8B1N3_BETVV|nr:hypothetical protein BVRB_013970 [Beta vulgaris subsp. vulgaris]